MPKTFNNLYEKIYDFKNLYSAYLKARRNKRYRDEVLSFSYNLEENLLQLQNELIQRTYHTGRYYSFYVYDPKKRRIFALPFRDRVIQHALSNIIEPIFDPRFIYDSYACRNHKGTHKATGRLTYFLRKLQRDGERVYCLKADIKKYFPSISHQILIEIIKRKIKCKKTLWLIKEIIYSTVDKEQIAISEEPSVIGCNSFASKGIPIGNLTSQIFANIYLNELDYFIKHNLKCPYYLRYMDDFIILNRDKEELHRKKELIEEFLGSELKLRLNKKSQIFPASCGIDFLGYRIWKTHRLLRKSNIKRMKRKLKILQKLYSQGKIGLFEIKQSLMSWLGHTAHANCYNLKKRILSEFVLRKGGLKMRRYWLLGLFLLLAISVQVQGWTVNTELKASTANSDARLKNVLGEVEPVLEKIKALKPIRYTWNKLGQQKVKTTAQGIRYGFLAQEMKKVFPEFISEGEDGYLLYNPSGYEAILTTAIQELLKEIDALRAEIDNLKAATANVGSYMTSPSYQLDVSRP